MTGAEIRAALEDIKKSLADAAVYEVCKDCYGGPVRNGHRPEHHGQVVDLDTALEAVDAAALAAIDPAAVLITEDAEKARWRDALEIIAGQSEWAPAAIGVSPQNIARLALAAHREAMR
jgi:hypothetical protein